MLSKQASYAIEIGFIRHRSLFHLEQKESFSATSVILSILITKFCILVNLESSNKIGSFEHIKFSIFCF